MLKIIQSHPSWILPLFSPRPASRFSPVPPEESAACITRDLCLRLFRHDAKWLAAEARKGTLIPVQGGLLQTTKWQLQYDNPVRRRIKRLRQTFASGAYVKLGFKPRWNRWTHIPRRYRGELACAPSLSLTEAALRRVYPFYFTLRHLVKTAERMNRQGLEVQQAEAAAAAAAPRVTFCAGQGTGRTDQPSPSKDMPPVRQRWSDGVVIRRPSVDLVTLYRPELLQPTATQDSAFFASFTRL